MSALVCFHALCHNVLYFVLDAGWQTALQEQTHLLGFSDQSKDLWVNMCLGLVIVGQHKFSSLALQPSF